MTLQKQIVILEYVAHLEATLAHDTGNRRIARIGLVVVTILAIEDAFGITNPTGIAATSCTLIRAKNAVFSTLP